MNNNNSYSINFMLKSKDEIKRDYTINNFKIKFPELKENFDINYDDINGGGESESSNKEYQEYISEKYKKYEIQDEKPKFKDICFPPKYKHQLPQLFLPEFMGPKTKNKGIMVMHKIGGGKTCTGILIGEEWKDKRKVFFITPASLITNLYKEFRTKCTGNTYISNSERKKLEKLNPSSKEYHDIIYKVNKRINKKYNIYSYHSFVNSIEKNDIDFNNSLLIFDEIQNVVSEKGKHYKIIYNALQNSPSSTRIVIMTATPIFDKPIELPLTLNLLKPKNIFPTGNDFNDMFIKNIDNKLDIKNTDLLGNLLKGLISYSPGAPSIAFPEKKFKVVRCQMSDFQYKSYLTVKKQKASSSFINILDLPNNFYIGERMISNISYPNKKVNEEGFNCLDKLKDFTFEDLKKYSCKFYKMINKINNTDGPAIVYSDFRGYGGLKAFIKILEKFGYSDALNNKKSKKNYGIWSGNETTKIKEMYKDLYNKYENKDGSLVKIMLISPSGKEGLSLFRTRTIHIMSSYWNTSRIEQVIGRGVRFCSHKDLQKSERNVTIYLYLAVSNNSKEELIDEYIYSIMLQKDKLIKKFYSIMEKNAVDKILFRNAKKFIKN